MDKIGTYGLYQNNYMRNAGAEQAERAAASRTEETKSPSRDQVRLSEGAQSLLKELKSAYGNSDFIIADYETEEEAASLLSRGKSQYSVLLTPEELEKMAADKDAKKDGLKTLEEAFSKLGEMKEQLGEKGRDVTRMGVAIGDDGEVSYFAELEKTNERQRERIQEKREEKRQEEKEKAKDSQDEKIGKEQEVLRDGRPRGGKFREPGKHVTVFGSSVEELAGAIDQVDWSRVPEDVVPSGHRYDFSV